MRMSKNKLSNKTSNKITNKLNKKTAKKILITAFLSVAVLNIAIAKSNNLVIQESKNQTTVTNVNLDKYKGTWYEIARLPMYFQRKCASDVTATYKKNTDGNINVVNKCTDIYGKLMSSSGLATVDKQYPDANNSKLLVSFLPSALRWLPFGKGGYWILALDTDDKTGEYTHAMVGSPSRKYLWILSRKSVMPEDDYQRYLETAKEQGYDLTDLTKTVHSNNNDNNSESQ